MSWIIVSSIALLGLFLSGFFSGAETGLYRANRLRLHLGVRRRDPQALRLASVLDDEQGALSVTLVGTNFANYATTTAVAYLFAELLQLGETGSELYTVAIVTPIIFVFGEMVPKNLFQLHPDKLLGYGSHLLAIANRLFRLTGIVWGLKRLAAALNRLAGTDSQRVGALGSKWRVAGMLQEALAGDTLGKDQSDLIDRVCRLSETPLHTVMVPRDRVRVIAADAGRRALLRIERKTGYAQLPVFDATSRRIIGTAKVDELLQSTDWQVVGDRLAQPLTLRPHETVAAAIASLQRANASMAVVIDRGGQMLGIVTLKDLLGEVLGELAVSV